MGRPAIDFTGKRFGYLVAQWPIGFTGKNISWLCLCDCGKLVLSNSSKLPRSRSCGCASIRNTIHGLCYSPEYDAWHAMRQRCLNHNNKRYADYGGRGIRICKRWDNFEAFFTDMGKRPPKMSLDRINNEGDYEPGNCQWATPKQQACNRRRRNIGPLLPGGRFLS